MNYFLRELRSGNKRYWAALAGMGVWMVAIIDLLSSSINPPGLLNGKWFQVTVILTILAPIIYYIYDFSTRSKKQKKTKTVEEEAAVFEPKREQEIREIIAENPEFITLCYECIHFESNLLTCARKLSDDVSYQRVKEIWINKIKYCLYWEKA